MRKDRVKILELVCTAFHVAAHCGDRHITKLLLDHSANINQQALDGSTSLYVTSDDTTCVLLGRGANVAARDNRGRIPLHIKVREGRLFAVQALIEKDSPVNLRDHQGVTPITSAVIHGNNVLVTELIHAGANDTQGFPQRRCVPERTESTGGRNCKIFPSCTLLSLFPAVVLMLYEH
ncbi:ankyrin [Tothia fuscella]|uniref:Ankyrin n=1 Tax=Tothia fuscella TaxID=1048955 RepID=A0A9P4NYS2_9PEZI|nr:ankyrin [Tothia fuscella]